MSGTLPGSPPPGNDTWAVDPPLPRRRSHALRSGECPAADTSGSFVGIPSSDSDATSRSVSHTGDKRAFRGDEIEGMAF